MTGIHEEASEEDVVDYFCDAVVNNNMKGDDEMDIEDSSGIDMKSRLNVRLNLDHRTGLTKPFALIEFQRYEDAFEAIKMFDGQMWRGNSLSVAFAFIEEEEEDETEGNERTK